MLKYFLVTAVLALAGCRQVDEHVTKHTQTQHIDLDKSEMVRVELSMGAGQLRLQGGTAKLMEGAFGYHGNRMPEIRYEPSSFRSRLKIRSGGSRDKEINTGGFGDEWDIRLNEDIAMDLDIKVGAGENRLDLGNFNIRDLIVDLGAGEVRVDLRGKPKRNMNVRVHGGVGEAKIWLPAGVGIRADAQGGIGSINVSGLTKRGSTWENDLYQRAPITVNVEVRGGIGSISIFAE